MSLFNQSGRAAILHQYNRIHFNNISKRSISSSKLSIEKTTDTSRFENKPKNDDLQFGHTISDHMLVVEWNKEEHWTAPKIVPYQDLKISPAATCLNYGACVCVVDSFV